MSSSFLEPEEQPRDGEGGGGEGEGGGGEGEGGGGEGRGDAGDDDGAVGDGGSDGNGSHPQLTLST